jgi:uncharacterized protein YjbI with pentapeptide repeats
VSENAVRKQPRKTKLIDNPPPSGAKNGQISDADVTALRSAANDASSRVAGLWLSFLTFMAYLTLTVGSVSHFTLLRADPVKLPVLNVELPLVAFFWIAPFFFVLFHFYLLLQTVILVRKMAAFQDHMQWRFPAEEDQERNRALLDTFLVVQFLFGSRDERQGTTSVLLRSVAMISLVIAPVLLLLQFQLTFLPYHHYWVVWAQRLSILIDIRLAWIFWYAIRRGDGEIRLPELGFVAKLFRRAPSDEPLWRRVLDLPSAIKSSFRQHRLAFCTSIFVVFASVFVASYKGEPVESLIELPYISDGDWEWTSLSDLVLHGPINMVEGKPRSWFSNVLVVPNQKFVTDKQVEDIANSDDASTISLRGRDLRGAILIRTDLRGADFTGANLNEARLDYARLSGAHFGCQFPPSRNRVSAAYSWPDDECTWLQAASLFNAHLESAILDHARMQGAVLISANLQGAHLSDTDLQDALLTQAQLQGAFLERTVLRRAFLDEAALVGTRMENVELEDALLSEARFDVVDMEGTKVVGSRGLPKITLSEGQMVFQVTSLERPPIKYDETAIRKLRKEIINGLPEDYRQYKDIDAKYEHERQTIWEKVNEQTARAEGRWKELVGAEAKERVGAEADDWRDQAIEEYLKTLACDPGSRPYVAQAIIDNERVKAVKKKYIGDFVTAIEDPKACPGAQALSALRLQKLLDFQHEDNSSPQRADAAGTGTATMTSSVSDTRDEQSDMAH